MVRKGKEAAAPSEKRPGDYITVTAQQSRYALDAVDAPASNEILIKDLSISVSDKELLSHAKLHLVSIVLPSRCDPRTEQNIDLLAPSWNAKIAISLACDSSNNPLAFLAVY